DTSVPVASRALGSCRDEKSSKKSHQKDPATSDTFGADFGSDGRIRHFHHPTDSVGFRRYSCSAGTGPLGSEHCGKEAKTLHLLEHKSISSTSNPSSVDIDKKAKKSSSPSIPTEQPLVSMQPLNPKPVAGKASKRRTEMEVEHKRPCLDTEEASELKGRKTKSNGKSHLSSRMEAGCVEPKKGLLDSTALATFIPKHLGLKHLGSKLASILAKSSTASKLANTPLTISSGSTSSSKQHEPSVLIPPLPTFSLQFDGKQWHFQPSSSSLIRVVTSSVKVQGVLAYTCVVLFYCGLISLKVLNSIVLLGKSCQYVKEANMEDKLFSIPPLSTPGKSLCKPQSKFKSTLGMSIDENVSSSVISQPSSQKENAAPLVTSNSDQFLMTPDGDDKDITQDNSNTKHRSTKKDLLEIDRFTICGNRID
ncbi:hypothetical protein JRQ81_015969, partial [Phrynocephalus forsythii]